VGQAGEEVDDAVLARLCAGHLLLELSYVAVRGLCGGVKQAEGRRRGRRERGGQVSDGCKQWGEERVCGE
jgi:hypothetical protein